MLVPFLDTRTFGIYSVNSGLGSFTAPTMKYLCLGVHCLLHFAEVLLQLVEGVLRLLRVLDEEQVLLFQRLNCMDDGGRTHSESGRGGVR